MGSCPSKVFLDSILSALQFVLAKHNMTKASMPYHVRIWTYKSIFCCPRRPLVICPAMVASALYTSVGLLDASSDGLQIYMALVNLLAPDFIGSKMLEA
nr:probable zinc transporter 10 [Ipomoea batatas]